MKEEEIEEEGAVNGYEVSTVFCCDLCSSRTVVTGGGGGGGSGIRWETEIRQSS
jgi:hypothetical protein